MLTKALLEKQAALTEEFNALCELEATRDLTAEEETRAEEITAELKKLDGKLDRAEEAETRNANLRQPASRAAMRGANPAATAGPQPKTEFENEAEFLAAIARHAKTGRADQRLNYQAAVGDDDQQMGVNDRGGFAIPVRFVDKFMSVSAQNAIVRPRATVIPAGDPPDGTIEMPALDQTDQGNSPATNNVFGGVSADWIEEGDEKPKQNFKIRKISLTPHEIAASLDVTDKLLRNWQAAGTLIRKLMADAARAIEDKAFLRGSGSGQPTGIVGHAATISVNRETSGTVTYDDLVNMEQYFLEEDAEAPIWLASRRVKPKLRKMEDSEGHLIWQENARVGEPATLLGKQIVFTQRMPALGQDGDIMLVDLSKYLIKEGSGPFIGASEHVRWRENMTVFKMFWLVDGKPWLTAPHLGEDDLQYSPFVQLDSTQAS